MSKRFIAYFIGVILATVALHAQDLEIETPEPCDIIPNTQIEWGEVQGYRTFLKCNCELVCQYYLSEAPDGQLHFNLLWWGINDHGSGCTDHKGCLIPNVMVDIDDVGGLENYLELEILERYMTFNMPQVPAVFVSSYRASCKVTHHWLNYPGGVLFPFIFDNISFVDGEFIHTTVSDLYWEKDFELFVGCLDKDCCISQLHLERNWTPYPGKIVKAQKGNVYLSPVNINCVYRCTVDCADSPYEYENKFKISDSQITNTQIIVAPMPNNGDFNVNIPNEIEGSYKYTLNNALGQEVATGIFEVGKNIFNGSSVLNSGLYTLVIEYPDNQIISKQIMILK